MDFDLSSLPSSTAGLVCAVVLAVVGIVGKWVSRRRETADELSRKICETEEALRVALENGMVTDAKRLAHRLDSLRKKYSRRFSATDVAVAVCLSLMTGCSSLLGREKVEYVVVGERINIVEPGQVVTVPELKPPAKKWYLVDNVGLEGWLGLGDR